MSEPVSRWRERTIGAALAFAVVLPASLLAGSIPGGSLTTFANGTVADANEVNANFAAVETAVNGNAADIATNASAIAANATAISDQATALAAQTSTAIAVSGFGSQQVVTGTDACNARTFTVSEPGDYVIHGRWNVVSNDTANCRYAACSLRVDGIGDVGVVGDLNDGFLSLGAEANGQYGTGYQFDVMNLPAGTHTLQWNCRKADCGSISVQCQRSQVLVYGPY